jgi:hypothetical protein
VRDAHIVDSDATSNIIAASPSMASAKIAFAMGYAVPAHLRTRSGRARHSLWQTIAQRCIFRRQPYFMARYSYFSRDHWICWLAKLNRTIFISRSEKQNVAQQVAELREAIAENWSVTLFPEGTTSDGRGLLPFKQSLFATLAPPPKPMMIQPVYLDFGIDGPDIAWLGEETGWESAWRAFTRPGSYDVGVHFLEPFDPAALADRKIVCALARSRIAAALSSKLGYSVT